MVEYEFVSQVENIPHPEKAVEGGEDAHFVSKSAIGIADGVGGWNKSGVNPKIFADLLMKNAFDLVKDEKVTDPLEIIERSYNKTNVAGGSTVLVISIIKDRIKSANLGDSGFLMIRDDKIIFRSEELVHGFNWPFQLGREPKTLKAIQSKPTKAETNSFKFKEGDLVIAGCDGLFDNLFESDIMEEVKKGRKKLAQRLARKAYVYALDESRVSPFTKKSNNEYLGGKMDDITVIVAEVRKK